jgi:predicted MFS family arabinose efflux permease
VVARLGAATTMRVGLLIETSTHLVLALARSPLLVAGILARFGFHAVTWNVTSVSLRQELVPSRLLGRVNSAYAVLAYGGTAVGALAGGLLARRLGLTAPFLVQLRRHGAALPGGLADPVRRHRPRRPRAGRPLSCRLHCSHE